MYVPRSPRKTLVSERSRHEQLSRFQGFHNTHLVAREWKPNTSPNRLGQLCWMDSWLFVSSDAPPNRWISSSMSSNIFGFPRYVGNGTEYIMELLQKQIRTHNMWICQTDSIAWHMLPDGFYFQHVARRINLFAERFQTLWTAIFVLRFPRWGNFNIIVRVNTIYSYFCKLWQPQLKPAAVRRVDSNCLPNHCKTRKEPAAE